MLRYQQLFSTLLHTNGLFENFVDIFVALPLSLIATLTENVPLNTSIQVNLDNTLYCNDE